VFYTTSRYFREAGTRSLRIQAFDPAKSSAEAFKGAPVSLFECASWFYAAEQGALGTKAQSKRLLGYLETVVETLLPGFSSLRIESSPPRLFVRKGQTEFELGQLSDGESGLLALAFDLTRRLAIANPRLKNPVTEGEAIVLLDEIELHLHPGWQRSAIRRLLQTFKSCQFIGTTHSPQVIGQARPDSLRLLHYDASGEVELQRVRQSFGMDSSWILQQIMDTPARDYATEQRLASVYESIDAKHFRKAQALITKLEKELGPFPELQEMTSLLDRLKLLKKR
jgi:predicted ATP-binding protein involved in virulence